MKKIAILILILLTAVFFCACGAEKEGTAQEELPDLSNLFPDEPETPDVSGLFPDEPEPETPAGQELEPDMKEPAASGEPETPSEPEKQPEQPPEPSTPVEPSVPAEPETPIEPSTPQEPEITEPEPPPVTEPDPPPATGNGHIVVIDAGHQGKGNSEKEPIAPGASEKKAKVTSGTEGTVTKKPEHEVNLEVSLKLKEELLARGYTVIMVRETADVNISNSERAAIANEAHADAFVRIHCNGADSAKVSGALTMCQTKNNPYCNFYKESRRLSEKVLTGLCGETGAKNDGIQETDTMSGINWCQVPVTIVEMGFMTNPDEDRLLCSDDYQNKLARGIANGIDAYFE